jgi:hypothetical protein
MLNGDYEEPDREQHSITIPWINRNGKRVNTVVNLDPNLAEYLTQLYKNDDDLYGRVFDEIEDFVALKAFVQQEDEAWFISKEILDLERKLPEIV